MTLITATVALILAQAVPEPPAMEEDVSRIDSLNFEFPVRVDPDRQDDIEEIQLFESWDKGATWTHIARFKADQKAIAVKAKRDGTVWYVLRVIEKNGVADPVDLSKSGNIQKVLIDTRPPFPSPFED